MKRKRPLAHKIYLHHPLRMLKSGNVILGENNSLRELDVPLHIEIGSSTLEVDGLAFHQNAAKTFGLLVSSTTLFVTALKPNGPTTWIDVFVDQVRASRWLKAGSKL